MTRVLLVGARGGGGEEVFVRGVAEHPPDGVTYDVALDPHRSVASARARVATEVLFNRLVHPFLWPLPGVRAYDVSRDVDVVHVHNVATLLRVGSAVPVVCSVGGSGYPHYLEEYLGWTRDRVATRYRRARRVYGPLGVRSEVATPERVDAVVVFSGFAAEVLRGAGVPADKLRVIPPGFDIPGRAPAEPPSRPFTFLLVGRDPRRKGADLAVAAFRRVRAEGIAVRLVLVGDPAYPAMGGDGVEGHGPVDRDTLFRDFYGAADAVLVPSRAEGFGFAAVEAMGHGVPVIASRRDALPWIVGDAGALVEPGDADALGRAMARLAGTPGEARALGRTGRRRFEDLFTVDRARGALGALYRELLGR